MIWKEKRVLLIVLGILLLANVVFFFTYRVQYQSRLNDLDERLAQAQQELEQTRAARLRAEQAYRSYKQVESDVQKVYNQHWATQEERLTAMIAEVKRLTVASSLVPTSIAFGRSEAAVQIASGQQRQGGRRRNQPVGAIEVGVGFGVSGTYEQVRRLINLLELSRQFVIIDQIGLAAAEAERLNFNLHVKTLFRDDSAEKERAANSRL